MFDKENPYAPPEVGSLAYDPREGTGEGIWRDGNLLIFRRDAELPDRCLRCNAPSGNYRLRRTLSWHRPSWFLVLLVSPLLYIIVAMIVRWQARVSVGLCDRHRAGRTRAIILGWLLGLGGIALTLGGAAGSPPVTPWMFFGGLALILVGLIGGVFGSQVLVPRRIDATYVTLRNVSPEYLAAFPDWDA